MLSSLLLLYLALNGFAYFFSERLIFLPPTPTYQDTADILKLTTQDGEQISAFYLPNPDATYTILYSHGNAEDLGRIRQRLANLRTLGFSVFAYDYRGYGTSQGKPSEQNALQDIEAAYAYLTNHLKILPETIVLYGRSLGGGPSVHLASRHPVAGVILESTFTSTFRVVTQIPILPWDRFNNLAKIDSVHGAVLFIHGTDDRVVPFHHSQVLYQRAKQPKHFVSIQGAGHNNLLEIAWEQYDKALNTFTHMLEQRKTETFNDSR